MCESPRCLPGYCRAELQTVGLTTKLTFTPKERPTALQRLLSYAFSLRSHGLGCIPVIECTSACHVKWLRAISV